MTSPIYKSESQKKKVDNNKNNIHWKLTFLITIEITIFSYNRQANEPNVIYFLTSEVTKICVIVLEGLLSEACPTSEWLILCSHSQVRKLNLYHKF